MHDIIDDLNNGKFEYETGTLDFGSSTIELTCPQHRVVEGSFPIIAIAGKAVEGIVRSTEYRMEVLTPSFSGARDNIAYRFHGEQLDPGAVVKGEFEIISNRGEYKVPFSVTLESPVNTGTIGDIRSLFHFTNLAKTNWREALDLFYTPIFKHIFRGADREWLNLYMGLSVHKGNEFNMEEFLVKSGNKPPIEILVGEEELKIENPIGVSRHQIEIVRNGWGYSVLTFESEGDFIRLGATAINEDSFLGNSYPLDVYIDEGKLHAGINLGCVHVTYCGRTQTIPVTVSVRNDKRQLRSLERARNQATIQLMQYYKAFRARRISTKTWLDECYKLTQEMVSRDYYDITAKLYQAQIMITQQRYNEAKWFLEKLRGGVEAVKSENPDLWCYYLYLTTLYSKEDAYVDEMTAIVQGYFEKDPGNWRLAWLLSYMSSEYARSMAKKWVMLESQFAYGCNSPVIYIEACHMVNANPSLLVKLDRFAIQVLRYLLKNDLMNRQLLLQILYLADREKEYHPQLLRILQRLYNDYPEDDLLQAICVQMIRGGLSGPEYFDWYQKGVDAQLRITRLFEFYMLSLDVEKQIDLPQTVLLYFSYHSDLDYEKNAYLFAYVIRKREQDPDMYTRYLTQIREYVVDSLKQDRITPHLAFLYREILTEDMVDAELAMHLAQVLFISRVKCTRSDTDHLVLNYLDYDDEAIRPIRNGYSYVPVYANACRIFLEDQDGNRVALDMEREVMPLMVPGRLLSMVDRWKIDHRGIAAHYIHTHRDQVVITEENVNYFIACAKNEHASDELKQTFYTELLQFFYEKDRMGELEGYLDGLNPAVIAPAKRLSFLEFLMRLTRYRHAYYLMKKWGPEILGTPQALELASGALAELPPDELAQEKILIEEIIWISLDNELGSGTLLEYMTENYNGSQRRMMQIYREAETLGIETGALCRRILERMLYTGAYLSGDVDVLKRYMRGEVDRDLMQALLNRYGYDSFVRQRVLHDDIFLIMTKALDAGLELHYVCQLAYLKHFAANRDQIGEREKVYIKQYMDDLIGKDLTLSCMKDYTGLFPEHIWLQDQTVVEYHTRPGQQAQIHFVLETGEQENSEYITEPMEEIYGGVFSKVFILFFGEKVQYYITEEADGTQQLTESGTLTRSDIGQDNRENRYTLLNDIVVGKTLQDYDTVDHLLNEYFRKKHLAADLFKMV